MDKELDEFVSEKADELAAAIAEECLRRNTSLEECAKATADVGVALAMSAISAMVPGASEESLPERPGDDAIRRVKSMIVLEVFRANNVAIDQLCPTGAK